MEGVNKKYNLEIEVLTPLSIGAGAEKDWVRGVDFVVNNGKLYKLNLKKILACGIKAEDLTNLFASKNEKGLKSLLAGNLESVSDFAIPFPAESDNDVKTFVKNQLTGNAILTGSSLKGSIRSVLFQYLGGKSKDGKEVFGSSTNGDEFMRFIKVSDAEFDKTELVNTKIFNLRGGGDNWQGGWKHQMTNRDGNSFTNGTFHPVGFNTLYESLVPEQKGYASLMMAERTFNNFDIDTFYKKAQRYCQMRLKNEKDPKERQKIEKNNIELERLLNTVNQKKKAILLENLFPIINEHTRNYLLKERAFFEKYHAERSDEIVDSIDMLLNQIPSDDSCCILKMSAGSGFHSITGDWQFSTDYFNGKLDRKRASKNDLEEAGKILPKSRKIADWNGILSLMGFVKLRTLNEEDVKKIEEKRQAEQQRKEQERLIELEANRIKAEEAAKEQREKDERKKLFDQAIFEVKQLVDTEQYEDAWSKYQSLCKAFPELKQTIIDVNLLKSKVAQMQTEHALKENADRQEQERLQAQKEKAEGGLAKLLNEKYEFGPNEGKYKVTSFKMCAQKALSWIKAAKVESIPNEQQSALFDSIKRLYNNPDKKEAKYWDSFESNIWKQIILFVGENTAIRWHQEITNN